MAQGAVALAAYYSDAELILILDFMRRATTLGLEQTARVRDLPPVQPTRTSQRAAGERARRR